MLVDQKQNIFIKGGNAWSVSYGWNRLFFVPVMVSSPSVFAGLLRVVSAVVEIFSHLGGRKAHKLVLGREGSTGAQLNEGRPQDSSAGMDDHSEYFSCSTSLSWILLLSLSKKRLGFRLCGIAGGREILRFKSSNDG